VGDSRSRRGKSAQLSSAYSQRQQRPTLVTPEVDDPATGRRARHEKLMAFVSDDDGQTWQGGLMLDEREKVTYPVGVQAPDGTIYIIYDYNRTPNGEVLLATFTEADVRAGKPVGDKIRLRGEVARLPIQNPSDTFHCFPRRSCHRNPSKTATSRERD